MTNPTGRRASTSLALLLLALAQSVPARADSPVETVFLLADRAGLASRAHLGFGLGASMEDPELPRLRLDAGLNYRHGSGLGAYAAVPLIAVVNLGANDTTAGLGNVELGATYAAGDTLAYVAKLGLVLPTAPRGGDAATAVRLSMYDRPADLGLVFTRAAYARLAGSAIWRAPAVVGRLDLGLDLPLWASFRGTRALPHATLGIATARRLGRASYSLEVSAVVVEEEPLDGVFTADHTVVGALALAMQRAGGIAFGLVAGAADGIPGQSLMLRLDLPLERHRGGSAQPAQREEPIDCSEALAAWHRERDVKQRTLLYDAMPAPCQRQLAQPES